MSTDTQDPRWSDETLALVAKAAFVDWTGGERDGLPTGDHLLANLTRNRWEALAHKVLAALADAGLLLPPGTETRTEWGVRYPELHPAPVQVTGEDMARHTAASGEGRIALRRTIHLTPWQAADTNRSAQ